MMARIIGFGAVMLALIAIFGWNPLSSHRDTSDLLIDGYSGFETGVKRQPNACMSFERLPACQMSKRKW